MRQKKEENKTIFNKKAGVVKRQTYGNEEEKPFASTDQTREERNNLWMMISQ